MTGISLHLIFSLEALTNVKALHLWFSISPEIGFKCIRLYFSLFIDSNMLVKIIVKVILKLNLNLEFLVVALLGGK